MSFESLNLGERLTTLPDGVKAVEFFEKLVMKEMKTIIETKEKSEKIVSQPVSLLLLDINMPQVDGFTAWKQI